MSEINDILDKIERYTKGHMDLEEKLIFEKELASDESLQRQLDLSELVDQMVVGAEAWKLKEQMRKDLFKPKSRVGTYLTASLLVLVAGSVSYFVFNPKNPKKELLQPEGSVPTVVSPVNKTDESSTSLSNSPTINTAKETNTITKTTSVSKMEAVDSKSVQVESTIKDEKTNVSPGPLNVSETQTNSLVPSPAAQTGTPSPIGHSTSVKASVPSDAKKQISHIDLCAGFIGEVEFTTLPSCKGEETGELYVKAETIKGGKAPYTFILGDRTAKSHFDRLSSGQYSLLIKDGNGCLREQSKKVFIAEKSCAKNKEYVFNQTYDQTWAIPYDKGKEAVGLKIMDRSGKIFFQTTVSAYQPSEWNGDSNTGLVLGLGVYFYMIEYADGGVEEGSVNVTR